MASTHCRELITSQNIAATPTEPLPKKLNLALDTNFIGFIKASNSSSANIVVKIEHSPNGEDWFDLITFTTITADVIEAITLDRTTDHVFEYVRADVEVSSGSADIICNLHYDRNAK